VSDPVRPAIAGRLDFALAQKTWTPCRGRVPPLTADEVETYLPRTPGWAPNGDCTKIEAGFRFKNFHQALEFVKDVSELAETEFHHPLEMTFGWGFCRMTLQTKKIKGLHENDFIMAAKVNQIAARHGASN
jgi:4a-hydroxytetrahydrobiopterin dehydratase